MNGLLDLDIPTDDERIKHKEHIMAAYKLIKGIRSGQDLHGQTPRRGVIGNVFSKAMRTMHPLKWTADHDCDIAERVFRVLSRLEQKVMGARSTGHIDD